MCNITKLTLFFSFSEEIFFLTMKKKTIRSEASSSNCEHKNGQFYYTTLNEKTFVLCQVGITNRYLNGYRRRISQRNTVEKENTAQKYKRKYTLVDQEIASSQPDELTQHITHDHRKKEFQTFL